jgi:hypothetical protein
MAEHLKHEPLSDADRAELSLYFALPPALRTGYSTPEDEPAPLPASGRSLDEVLSDEALEHALASADINASTIRPVLIALLTPWLAAREAAQQATVTEWLRQAAAREAALMAERDAAVKALAVVQNAAKTLVAAKDRISGAMTQNAVDTALAPLKASTESEREMNALLTLELEHAEAREAAQAQRIASLEAELRSRIGGAGGR